MSFETLQLKPALLKAIQQCGYSTPTPIQAEAIPQILAGQDVIASAHTGTGKTATFVLPALQKILTRPYDKHTKRPKGQPSVLILTPTRELANQVSVAIRNYGKFVRFHSVTIFGGMPYGPQLRMLARPVDIVIATPGRLLDHIEEQNSIDLSAVEILVLDEADRMLDMGFIDEVKKIAALTPATRQTLLFTATWDNTMADLGRRLLKQPQRIQMDTQPTQHNIEQRLHVADNFEHKNRLLQHFVSDVSLTQAIIFSSTKQGADSLAQGLLAQGHSAAALHGDMTQAARNRTLMNLRKGKVRLLVATDVAARGLDVCSVSHVINFDIPRFAEDYVHRIGRTGRAGAAGTAISFVLPDDMLHWERIERYTGQSVQPDVIPGLEPKRLPRRFSKNKKRSPPPDYANLSPRRNFYKVSKRHHFQQPTPHHKPATRGSSHKKVTTAVS